MITFLILTETAYISHAQKTQPNITKQRQVYQAFSTY